MTRGGGPAVASRDGHRASSATAAGAHRGRIARPTWIAAAAVVTAAVAIGAVAAGWDVGAWLRAVWESLTSISLVYLVPALALQTLQTIFAAAAWHGILRYAYPETVWNIVLAAVVVAAAFGRTGGRRLVAESPAGARALHAQGRQASP